MPIPVDMRNLVCMSVDLIGSPSKPDFQNMYVIPNRSIQLRWCLGIAEGPTMDRLCWQEINLILPRSMEWEEEDADDDVEKVQAYANYATLYRIGLSVHI